MSVHCHLLAKLNMVPTAKKKYSEPITISTEQKGRLNLEVRSNKLITGTLVFRGFCNKLPPKNGLLETTEIILSQFCGPETQNQGAAVSRGVSRAVSRGEFVLVFSSFWWPSAVHVTTSLQSLPLSSHGFFFCYLM